MKTVLNVKHLIKTFCCKKGFDVMKSRCYHGNKESKTCYGKAFFFGKA